MTPAVVAPRMVGMRTPDTEIVNYRSLDNCGKWHDFSSRALFTGALLASWTGLAHADRHCAPVMEYYWQARTVLLNSEEACVIALEASEDALREATAQAGICGCNSLQDHMEYYLFGNDESGAPDCSTRKERILELSSELPDLVESCH